MKNKLIVITGGHHNSALVLAKDLINNGYQILWLGHKYVSQESKNLSEEYKEITEAKIEFINLDTGKIHRGGLSQWFKFLTAIKFCLDLFKKRKPALVIGYGGYLSPPAVVAAWFLRIKTIAHEQTNSLGLANRAILIFVDKMFLSWPKDFHSNIFWKIYINFFNKKFIVSGLPVKTNVRQQTISLSNYFDDLKKPLLLISGGKQGSHIINKVVKDSLLKLLPQYNILHQTGNNLKYKDLQQLQSYRQALSQDLQKSYYPFGYSSDFSKFLEKADLVIGRSGAHTVFDLLRFYKKTVAIPLTFSFANEQYFNALRLKTLGLGIILKQDNLNSESLVQAINRAMKIKVNKQKVDQFLKQIPKDSSKFLLQEIEKLL